MINDDWRMMKDEWQMINDEWRMMKDERQMMKDKGRMTKIRVIKKAMTCIKILQGWISPVLKIYYKNLPEKFGKRLRTCVKQFLFGTD